MPAFFAITSPSAPYALPQKSAVCPPGQYASPPFDVCIVKIRATPFSNTAWNSASVRFSSGSTSRKSRSPSHGSIEEVVCSTQPYG